MSKIAKEWDLINLIFKGINKITSLSITNSCANLIIPNIEELFNKEREQFIQLGYKVESINKNWTIKQSDFGKDTTFITKKVKFSKYQYTYTQEIIVSLDENFRFVQCTSRATI